MKKLILPLTLMMTALAARAQHAFEYVCETDAMQFLIDRYTATTQGGLIEVWEKRQLQKNAAGQAEARRMQTIYPALKLGDVAYYYVKQEVDTTRRRSRTLSVYFFDSRHNEIGYQKPPTPGQWETAEPETVADLEMNHIIKIARRPQRRPNMQ